MASLDRHREVETVMVYTSSTTIKKPTDVRGLTRGVKVRTEKGRRGLSTVPFGHFDI